MNKRELDVLKHATGWPNMHRDHYVASEGDKDHDVCESLVSQGLMTKHKKTWIIGDLFLVTDKGKDACNQTQESEAEK